MAGARRRNADRAIELGIALESLLGETSQSEISHKIAVRGSLFVSSRADDRLEIFRLLKAVYKLRSKVVHGGQFKDDEIMKNVNLTTAEVIQKGTDIARVVLNKIVDAGSIPDWTKVDLAIETEDGSGT